MDKAKTLYPFTYDHSWQYLHCKKEEVEHWSETRICVNCKRKAAEERDRVSGSGNSNGKRQGRLILENGKWVLRG